MLYHKQVFMPEPIKALPATTLRLEPSHHALQAALNDRYGEIAIPQTVTFRGRHIIEVETDGAKKVIKLVVRRGYNLTHDVIYVLKPIGSTSAVVKTVWLNRKTDLHETLKWGRGFARS